MYVLHLYKTFYKEFRIKTKVWFKTASLDMYVEIVVVGHQWCVCCGKVGLAQWSLLKANWLLHRENLNV